MLAGLLFLFSLPIFQKNGHLCRALSKDWITLSIKNSKLEPWVIFSTQSVIANAWKNLPLQDNNFKHNKGNKVNKHSKVNNKDTRTTPLLTWNIYFTHCCSFSIVYFEYVIAGWVQYHEVKNVQARAKFFDTGVTELQHQNKF